MPDYSKISRPGLIPVKIENQNELLTTQVNKINFTGSGVTASVGEFNDINVYIDGGVAPSASYALSASYAATASYLEGTIESASYAETASYAIFAETASLTEYSDLSRNTIASIKNVSGVSFPKGTPLYVTESGVSGNLLGVIPADAGDPSLMPAGVISAQDLDDGEEGIGYIDGFINGVDTSAFNSGDEVFVGVGGGYTNIRPTGSALIQPLGYVEKVDSTNGSGLINGPGHYFEVPNISSSYLWVGNADQVAVPVSTASLHVSSSISSSYTETASYVNPLIQDVIITGSLTVSGSSTFRNIGPGEFTGSVDVNGKVTSLKGFLGIADSVGGSATLRGANDNTFISINSSNNIILKGSTSIDLGVFYDGNYRSALIINSGKTIIGSNYSTSGSKVDITGNVKASSSLATSLNLQNNLTAQQNNDTLVGLDIKPTYTTGSFTGIKTLGLRANNNSEFTGSVSVYKSGSTVLNVEGSSGQLFSITDSLTGSLFSVNTVAGLPVIEAFSDNTVNIGKFGVYPIKVVDSGSSAVITGSFTGSFTGDGSIKNAETASYVNPLVQDVEITGSLTVSDSLTTSELTASYALINNDAIINGVRIGLGAGAVSTNTTIGNNALDVNTTGVRNTAVGYTALGSNTTTQDNTAIGYEAALNSNARETTAVGSMAAKNTTTGRSNTAIGMYSLLNNTTGAHNTGVGKNSLAANIIGDYNTAVGDGALEANTASNNTALGRWAGYFNTSGTGNVFLGYQAGYNNTTSSNKLYIANNSASALIYGDFSTGDIMIGTTTDSARLSVKGSGTTSATTALLIQNANATASLLVNDAGNVLIGTTTDAGFGLDVNSSGGVMFRNPSYSNSVISFKSTGNITAGMYISNTASITRTANGGFAINDSQGGGARLTLFAGGSGTTSLYMYGNVGFSSGTKYILFNHGSVEQNLVLRNAGGGGQRFEVQGRGSFGANYTSLSAPTDGLAIEGNVLIGTTTDAGYKLDVSGSGNFTDDLTVTGSILQEGGLTQEFYNLPAGLPAGITPIISKALVGSVSMFLEYQIVDTVTGTDQRTGTIMANFNNAGTPDNTFTETVTADIGNTSGVTFSTAVSPSYEIQVNNAGPNPYSFKGILRYF